MVSTTRKTQYADGNYSLQSSEETQAQSVDKTNLNDSEHTPGYPKLRVKSARLSDTDVDILRDTAVSLQNANIAFTESLARKNKAILVKYESLARKRLQIEKLKHENAQLEEMLKQKSLTTIQNKRDRDRDHEILRGKLEKMPENFTIFKEDTAKLVATVTRQMEVYSRKQCSHMQARSVVKYNDGYLDAGGILAQHDKIDGRENLKEAQQDERQALRILNEHLSELFDLVGINPIIQH